MVLESVLTGVGDPTNVAAKDPPVVVKFFFCLEVLDACDAYMPVGTHQVWSVTQFNSVDFLLQSSAKSASSSNTNSRFASAFFTLHMA